MVSSADLHVHSRYSDRPSEWILRRIGSPECYTKPRKVYDLARRRGMQFVTISDHNCIDGALEIAHLPGAFVSNEITTYFPSDRCKVHVLCWDITEAQFADIERARHDIVELRDYMHREGIVHACAHPLYAVNDRLTMEHFEELLVLFNVFETMNGGRNRRGNDLVSSIVTSLTRADFERLVDRHGIQPVGEQPWIKGTTGGSDDHSGVFIAKGFTQCDWVATPRDFLAQVAARRSKPGGLDGTPLSFAHSLYSIGYQYYSDKFLTKAPGGTDLMVRTMEEIFGKQHMQVRLKDRVSYLANRLAGRPDRVAEVEFKRTVSTEMAQLFGQDWLGDDFAKDPARYHDLNRRTFELASKISNQLLFQFSRKFVSKLSAGSVFGSLEALSAVGPIALGVAPYLFSFAHQNRDKAFLNDVSHAFLKTPLQQKSKIACLVDTTMSPDVAATLRTIEQLPEASADRTIITFGRAVPGLRGPVRHFDAVGDLLIPGQDWELAFPPILDLLDYCDSEQFTTIIVASPGLASLATIAVGKLVGAQVVGVCESDLPARVLDATGDEDMEDVIWGYLRWFYDQADLIYTPSESIARKLGMKGVNSGKIRLAPVPDPMHVLGKAV